MEKTEEIGDDLAARIGLGAPDARRPGTRIAYARIAVRFSNSYSRVPVRGPGATGRRLGRPLAGPVLSPRRGIVHAPDPTGLDPTAAGPGPASGEGHDSRQNIYPSRSFPTDTHMCHVHTRIHMQDNFKRRAPGSGSTY